MSASQTTTVTETAQPAGYTLFIPPSAAHEQLPTAAATPTIEAEYPVVPTQEEHLPMQFNAAKPTFADKYAERRYVKERLALGYRVIASICHREPACLTGENQTLMVQRKAHPDISPCETPSIRHRSGSIPTAYISAG